MDFSDFELSDSAASLDYRQKLIEAEALALKEKIESGDYSAPLDGIPKPKTMKRVKPPKMVFVQSNDGKTSFGLQAVKSRYPCPPTATIVDKDNPVSTALATNSDVFSAKDLLSKAVPGTRLYDRIMTSTPVLASRILTEHLDVQSMKIAYMDPNMNLPPVTFYAKK